MLEAKCDRGRVTIEYEYDFKKPSEIYADISTILYSLIGELEDDGLKDVKKHIAAAAVFALVSGRADND